MIYILFEKNSRKCKSTCEWKQVVRIRHDIDDYHTLVGSNVYHICEFAEVAQRAGTVYEPLDPTQQPADAGCYEIYQIDNVAKVDYAFMRYERAKGKLRAAHYRESVRQ